MCGMQLFMYFYHLAARCLHMSHHKIPYFTLTLEEFYLNVNMFNRPLHLAHTYMHTYLQAYEKALNIFKAF